MDPMDIIVDQQTQNRNVACNLLADDPLFMKDADIEEDSFRHEDLFAMLTDSYILEVVTWPNVAAKTVQASLVDNKGS